MSVRLTLISILFCTNIIACEETYEANVTSTVPPEESSETTPKRQLIQSNNPQELSCLKQCGAEARGTVYGDCIEAGEDQQECAVTGREWYRECLAERCGEAALQQDDCMVECRLSSKDEHKQCVAETEDPKICRENVRSKVRECIAECE